MAYMRGTYYIWKDDKNIYFYQDSLPLKVFDKLVVMRMAELLNQKKELKKTIKGALEYAGNFGCSPLCKLQDKLSAEELIERFKKTLKKKRRKKNGR